LTRSGQEAVLENKISAVRSQGGPFGGGADVRLPEGEALGPLPKKGKKMRHENLQSLAAMPWEEATSPVVASNDNRSLGHHEWAVIDMARNDGPRSANPNSLLNSLLRTLFGVSIPRPLANERLETLRRFAVAAWFRTELRARDLGALFAAGFSSNDAARIIAHVALSRGSAPEIEAWP
jgi:hypothetical protein